MQLCYFNIKYTIDSKKIKSNTSYLFDIKTLMSKHHFSIKKSLTP